MDSRYRESDPLPVTVLVMAKGHVNVKSSLDCIRAAYGEGLLGKNSIIRRQSTKSNQ